MGATLLMRRSSWKRWLRRVAPVRTSRRRRVWRPACCRIQRLRQRRVVEQHRVPFGDALADLDVGVVGGADLDLGSLRARRRGRVVVQDVAEVLPIFAEHALQGHKQRILALFGVDLALRADAGFELGAVGRTSPSPRRRTCAPRTGRSSRSTPRPWWRSSILRRAAGVPDSCRS